MQLALAAAAALLAMLLFVPALRFARAYWLQMSPPDWAAEYLSARPLHTATLLLHLLLPVLTSLLWVSSKWVGRGGGSFA